MYFYLKSCEITVVIPIPATFHLKGLFGVATKERYSTVPFSKGGGIFFMKPKKRKKRISRVPYSRFCEQSDKQFRKLIQSCNAEENERLWQRIKKAIEEENP